MADAYHDELLRLSSEAEFLRHEMAAGLARGDDVTEMHESLDRLRCRRMDIAMTENDLDFDRACSDIDASVAAVRARPVHDFVGARH